jgi:hypothetical protein
MAYGNERSENVRFKDGKPVFILKLKIYIYIYICWYDVFAFQRPFLEL